MLCNEKKIFLVKIEIILYEFSVYVYCNPFMKSVVMLTDSTLIR